MDKTFFAVAEAQPGPKWREPFAARWPRTKEWYLKDGLAPRPTPAAGRAALAHHMPEIVPVYDSLCTLVGDDEIAHRALTCCNPPSVITGCSQLVWQGAEGPALIRNYDFELQRTTGIIESTRWLGRRVIAMREAAWGCLDGMNEDGLAVSLTFGGRKAHGRGFAMPLILRYVLETCRTVKEGVAALTRIPVHQAQNVTLLDRSGDHATVFVGTDRAPAVTAEIACTNHQEEIAWPEMAARSRSVERRGRLDALLGEPAATLSGLAASFLAPPLYVCNETTGFATVYSAVYRPAVGSVTYFWPGKQWQQSFAAFEEGSYTHRYAPASMPAAAAS